MSEKNLSMYIQVQWGEIKLLACQSQKPICHLWQFEHIWEAETTFFYIVLLILWTFLFSYLVKWLIDI